MFVRKSSEQRIEFEVASIRIRFNIRRIIRRINNESRSLVNIREVLAYEAHFAQARNSRRATRTAIAIALNHQRSHWSHTESFATSQIFCDNVSLSDERISPKS